MDVRVIQHPLEQGRITVGGHGLITVGEIAVVAADRDRHPACNRRIQRLRLQPPLFAGVVGEDLVEHIVAEETQVGVRSLLHQGRDTGTGAEAEGLDQPLRQPLGHSRREQQAQRVEVERHGHQAAVHMAAHPVEIGPPVGEPAQVVEDAPAVGVEDVRPVGVDQPPSLVAPIMGVAACMVASVDDQHRLIQFARQLFRHRRPGEAGADDQPVVSSGRPACRPAFQQPPVLAPVHVDPAPAINLGGS